MKRVFLFVVTNLGILAVLSISMQVLGVDRMLQQNGLNLTGLLIMAAIMGMGGAFISLLLSKWMAKSSVGAEVITQPRNNAEAWLLETVRRQAQAAGIGMPEVAVYQAAEPNAFATGANRNNALVAVSTGLLQSMDEDEIEAVLAHEVSHVANGDMVTLALIQGVVNTFVMFLSRIIGTLVDRVVFKVERGQGPAYYITVIVAELVLGVLASIVVMWFSRYREFHADAGSARISGKHKMIRALQRLESIHSEPLPGQLSAFGIAGGGGLTKLFMTHPPLQERIAALQEERYLRG
jgi:heat shock protein HtpX